MRKRKACLLDRLSWLALGFTTFYMIAQIIRAIVS
ncbi:hypothetical protein Mahau_0552 [Mahella australiensis 50-1 BON]|uniref:Uncharacterized protein n=1 Tax=Mahella australiensis (strain DSM 15567 / CIP 107919 / 50-1 BON) TaxID=697281 RepID=F3ZZE6_MAHA5|nr:hypothetical protein Mahau_0552 [Mahella australiensis 50-1 BON]